MWLVFTKRRSEVRYVRLGRIAMSKPQNYSPPRARNRDYAWYSRILDLSMSFVFHILPLRAIFWAHGPYNRVPCINEHTRGKFRCHSRTSMNSGICPTVALNMPWPRISHAYEIVWCIQPSKLKYGQKHFYTSICPLILNRGLDLLFFLLWSFTRRASCASHFPAKNRHEIHS